MEIGASEGDRRPHNLKDFDFSEGCRHGDGLAEPAYDSDVDGILVVRSVLLSGLISATLTGLLI